MKKEGTRGFLRNNEASDKAVEQFNKMVLNELDSHGHDYDRWDPYIISQALFADYYADTRDMTEPEWSDEKVLTIIDVLEWVSEQHISESIATEAIMSRYIEEANEAMKS